MKNNPLTTVLLGALTISALLSVGFCWRYASTSRELRALQTGVFSVNQNRAMVSALVNDVVEYGKSHPNPAIDQIIESVLPKAGKPAPAATNKPVSK